jgi:hypothetical protein
MGWPVFFCGDKLMSGEGCGCGNAATGQKAGCLPDQADQTDPPDRIEHPDWGPVPPLPGSSGTKITSLRRPAPATVLGKLMDRRCRIHMPHGFVSALFLVAAGATPVLMQSVALIVASVTWTAGFMLYEFSEHSEIEDQAHRDIMGWLCGFALTMIPALAILAVRVWVR